MRTTIAALTLSFLFVGCRDVVDDIVGLSKPQLRNSAPVVPASTAADDGRPWSAAMTFPHARTLTDSNGRSIEVQVLAKKENEIVIARVPSLDKFVIPTSKLSDTDRGIFESAPDGGEFDAFSLETQLVTRGSRTATWHSRIDNAERESKNLGLPLLVAVVVSKDSQGDRLEKSLVYSREFRAWANDNVALCLIRADDLEGGGSRDTAFETWKTLARYGIAQSSRSSVTLISVVGSTGEALPLGSVMRDGNAIAVVEEAIRKKSTWASIKAAPAPERAASPFRVNGGARFIDSGGCSSGSS